MTGSTACIDATVVLQLLLNNEDQKVLAQWKQWDFDRTTLIAPTLLVYEVTAALKALTAKGTVRAGEGRDLLGLLSKLGLALHGDTELHQEALTLALELHTDAEWTHYLALAQRFDCPLYTCDEERYAQLGATSPALKLIR